MTRIARDGGGAPVQSLRPARTEKVTVDGTSRTPSFTPHNTTTVFRVAASVDLYFKIEDSPTAAVTGCPFLPGGAIEYLPVHRGETIAVIADSTSGFATISECQG